MAQTIQLRRTTTLNNPPSSLANGELAAGLTDNPVRLWIGTPTGVRELFTGNFDRNFAVETGVDRAVDLAHSPGSKQGFDLKRS